MTFMFLIWVLLLLLGIFFNPNLKNSMPSNIDYRYFIKERKKIPKSVQLSPEIFVKSIDVGPLPTLTNTGKRIILCGTTNTTVPTVFIAIFNTLNNMTEYLYQGDSNIQEVCKGIEIDKNNNQILIITDRKSENPLDETCINQLVPGDPSWFVLVRAFSLDRLVLEWTRLFGHHGFDSRYACSSVTGNYLIISYHTNYAHSYVVDENLDVEFAVLRTETGEGSANDCQMVLESQNGQTKVISMVSAGEKGIYLLLSVPQGKTKYVKDSLEITFDNPSYAIVLFELNTASITLNLLDIEAYKKSNGPFSQYPPTRLVVYYPSGTPGIGVPEILVFSHLNPTEKSGLMIYGYSNPTPDASNLLTPVYNPFVTADGCSDITNCERCLVSNTAKCMQCKTGKLSSNLMTCAANCADGWYKSDDNVCIPCHASCSKCSGPLRTQCTACSVGRTFDVFTGSCSCPAGNYARNGGCVAECSTGQSGAYKSGICRDKCPAHTMYFAEYTSVPNTKGIMSASEGYSYLKFDATSTGCLILPGPTGATSVPNEFTISLWVYYRNNWISTNSYLLWAFNSVAIKLSPFSATEVRIQLEIYENGATTTLPAVADTDWRIESDKWNYIGASVRNGPAGYEIEVLTAPHTAPAASNLGTKTSATDFLTYRTPYTNNIYVGCEGEYNSGTNSFNVKTSISFAGYLRELVYLNKFYSKAMLTNNMQLSYQPCIQMYKYVMSYWRFDSLPASGTDIILSDSSKYSLTKTISNSANPHSDSPSPSISTPGCNSKWEILGQCLDLFGKSNFPSFSLDTTDFAARELEPRINVNLPQVLWQIIKPGDKIRYTYGKCDTGPFFDTATANVELLDTGYIKIETKKPLPLSVRGTFVNVCYFSEFLGTNTLLGRTYFVLPPTRAFPSHGTTQAASGTTLKFEFEDGDQSFNDKIVMVNINRDVEAGLSETVFIDEANPDFATYSAYKKSDYKYTTINPDVLDSGTYTIGWRPSYMYKTVSGTDITYKNMFVSWVLQSTPKARFPPLEGAANSFKNSAVFKAELFYLDIVGPGQSDGDQILFCHTGCNWPNKKGGVYERINGQYPPVWFGDEVGVGSLLGSALYERLFLCWRPAARVKEIEPGDDQWVPIIDYQRNGVSAYVFINYVTENAKCPEIESMNPPIENPVLREGETVWFKLTQCRDYSPKPAMGEATPGKVEIVHLTYNSYAKTSYTTETIWSQVFSGVVEDGGYTIGKLKGDPDNCNFTLNDIPFDSMVPGHDYMLIIYSKSFLATSGQYLFGDITAGKATFKYIFRFQEARFNIIPRQIMPSETEITISGSGFGTVQIPGNGFTETRKLFGIIVNPTVDPLCGGKEIRASYLVNSLDDNPSAIIISGLDLSQCSGTFTLDMKFIKVSDDYLDYPLWSYTTTKVPLEIGVIGCDPTCKTCNGTTNTDCTSCSVDTPYAYLYKGRCVSKCEADMPFSDVMYYPGTFLTSYYVCTKSCGKGYFLDTRLNMCMQCNSQCRTCYSGNTMSCIDCKGTIVSDPKGEVNYNNTYRETYLFKRMCMLTCPVIINEVSSAKENLISTEESNKKCSIKYKPQGVAKIEVNIQPVIFPERVNIKRGVFLRALISDPISLLKGVYWSAHPAEDQTIAGFYTSDKRAFLSYAPEAINNTVISLNMNAFNYKGENDEMRIYTKAWTNDSLDFDIIELYGDRPPELKDENVFFSQTKGLKTGGSVDIEIDYIQDADDYFEILKFKVILVPRSLTIGDDVKTTTAKSALMLLAQLPEKYITIHANKMIIPNEQTVILKDVYIPPLIPGPQMVAGEVETDIMSCDFFILVEDRHMGVSKVKFSYNITETYRPSKRTETIRELYQFILAKNDAKTVEWDDILRIANTFRTINPTRTMYYMSYMLCSRDDQCSGHGKCVTSGGWSECVCDTGFVGSACSWKQEELEMENAMTRIAFDYLNSTVLMSLKANIAYNPNYIVQDINLLDQIANTLIGLLKNPEVVEEKYLPIVIDLCTAMTRMDQTVGGRLEDSEKANLFEGIDVAFQYTYYHLRHNIYEFYVLGESRDKTSLNIEAKYYEKRRELQNIVMVLRDSLFKLTDAISLSQHPGVAPYQNEFASFEIFVTAEREDALFEELGGTFAIQMRSGKGFIKFPRNILESVRDSVSINEEFKIRLVRWSENPYVFSTYHTQILTSVYSMAVLDANGMPLTLNLSQPIVFFLPTSNLTKNFERESVICKYFNNTHKINGTVSKIRKVNVNQLNATEYEKKLAYPEWDARLYQNVDLIIDEETYENEELEYPEFVDSDGISSYGSFLTPASYDKFIPCAAFHLSEIAAVALRKKSNGREIPNIGFYHNFDPLRTVDMTLGIYVCIVMVILSVCGIAASCVMDSILLPDHEKVIEAHRQSYYEDKEIELGSMEGDKKEDEKVPEGQTVFKPEGVQRDNGEGNISGGSLEEEVKMENLPVNEKPPKRRRKDKAKRKAEKKDGERADSGGDPLKDSQTDENLQKKGSLKSTQEQTSQTKNDAEKHDTSLNTVQNQTTINDITKDLTNTNSGLNKSSQEDASFNQLFSNVQGDELRKKTGAEDPTTVNIFSNDYMTRREQEDFEFWNVLLYNNMVINIILRTNSVYTRAARTFIFLSYVYFIMFWCAILIASASGTLDHPEEIKKIPTLLVDNIYIMFVVPIIVSFLMFLAAGIYKVNDSYLRDSKSISSYRKNLYFYEQ